MALTTTNVSQPKLAFFKSNVHEMEMLQTQWSSVLNPIITTVGLQLVKVNQASGASTKTSATLTTVGGAFVNVPTSGSGTTAALNATLVTTGRGVQIMMIPDNDKTGPNPAFVSLTSAAGTSSRLDLLCTRFDTQKGTTTAVGMQSLANPTGLNTSIPVSSFVWMDYPKAGNYTWTIQWRIVGGTTPTATIQWTVLNAYER